MSVCVKGETTGEALALKLDQKVRRLGERHQTADTGAGEVPRRISQMTPFDVRPPSESGLMDGCSQSEALRAITALPRGRRRADAG